MMTTYAIQSPPSPDIVYSSNNPLSARRIASTMSAAVVHVVRPNGTLAGTVHMIGEREVCRQPTTLSTDSTAYIHRLIFAHLLVILPVRDHTLEKRWDQYIEDGYLCSHDRAMRRLRQAEL